MVHEEAVLTLDPGEERRDASLRQLLYGSTLTADQVVMVLGGATQQVPRLRPRYGDALDQARLHQRLKSAEHRGAPYLGIDLAYSVTKLLRADRLLGAFQDPCYGIALGGDPPP